MILVIGGSFQGKHDFAGKRFPGKSCIEFEDIFRKHCDGQGAVPQGAPDAGAFDEWRDAVVIADENSSGVVPADNEAIHYRESYNRLLTSLAEEADEVYRVFCGLDMRLK